MNKDSAVIICTRPQSNRLPGKVFKEVGGVPAIDHILSRLKGCGMAVVLAVPFDCHDYDYLIQKYDTQDIDLKIFYGNAESPLHRMYDASKSLDRKINWIVRITHDDLLIDQMTMLDVLEQCKSTPGCGYGISPKIVEGAGVEVIRFENLENAAKTITKPIEHISYFVKEEPFCVNVNYKPRASICRPYRLTMDYYEDFVLLDLIFKNISPHSELDDVCEFIDKNPHILEINRIPEITIYMCAYNAAKWIDHSLMTVFFSNYYGRKMEFILVDDASTDRTLLVASKYSLDNKIKYLVNEKNIGTAESSNRAIRASRGKYIMRLDSDDLLVPGAVEKMIKKIEESGASIIYPAYKELNGELSSGIIDPEINHHAGCALMDRRMIMEFLFKDNIRHYDSYELYRRIMKSRFRIEYIKDDALWYYRKRNGSLSSKNTLARKKTLEDIENSLSEGPTQ